MKNIINTNFLKELTYSLQDTPSTLNFLSRNHLNKALSAFFNKLESQYKISDTQIIGILLKVKFINGSIKSLSTYRKGSIKSKLQFLNLFKHMINIRSEYYSSEENKVILIIFSYNVYSPEYIISDIDNDLLFNENKAITSDSKDHINYKEDSVNRIKYMDPLKLFKLPLSYAGSYQFHDDFIKLNNNVSDSDPNYKYKLIIKQINSFEVEVLLTLQEYHSIVIYKFKDRLISIPKLDKTEILIERIIMSKKNIYI